MHGCVVALRMACALDEGHAAVPPGSPCWKGWDWDWDCDWDCDW